MDVSPYRAPYMDPIIIEDDDDDPPPPPKRQKTASETPNTNPDLTSNLGSGAVGSNVQPGHAKVSLKFPQPQFAAAQDANGGHGSNAPSPVAALPSPALAPTSTIQTPPVTTTPPPLPQTHLVTATGGIKAPEIVPAVRPVIKIKMKKTGTVGLAPGPSTPRPVHGVTASAKPWEPERPQASVPTGGAAYTQDGGTTLHPSALLLQQLLRTKEAPPPQAAKTPETRPQNVKRRDFVPTASFPNSTPTATPEPNTKSTPAGYPAKRPRGRPRKDGSNTRAGLPSSSDREYYSHTLDGRSYESWPDQWGITHYGEGALFPGGYVVDSLALSNREWSWVCPVVGCKASKHYLKSFGKHFKSFHGDCFLNDFQDGTFGIVGYHNGKDQPRVTSRDKKEESTAMAAIDTEMPDVEKPGPRTNSNSHRAAEPAQLGENKVETPSQRPVRRDKAPSEREPFLKTPLGVPYESLTRRIVPLPALYSNWASDPGQWVCPILACRWSTFSYVDLVEHFRTDHMNTLLNDNLNGTFSEVVARRNPGIPSEGGLRSVVVSRMPPEELELELKACGDDIYGNFFARRDHSPAVLHGTTRQGSAASFQSTPDITFTWPAEKCDVLPPEEDLPMDADATWTYLQQFFKTFQHPTTAGWVMDILKLPKKRELAWNVPWFLRYDFVDKLARDVAALLIQVTGDIPEQHCSRCRDGNDGPFAECIVISKDAPDEARKRIAACGNCTYDGRETSCSLWVAKRAEESATNNRIVDQAFQPRPFRTESHVPALPGSQATSTTQPVSAVRGPERVQVPGAMGQSEAPNGMGSYYQDEDSSLLDDISTPSPPLDWNPTPIPVNREQAAQQPKQQPLRQAKQHLPPKLKTPGKQQPPQLQLQHMPMEDWERAPGRLRSTAPRPDDDTGPAENIAFSKAYLTANHKVRVSADAAFRVDVIGSGSSLRWNAKRDMLRICSVDAGKVKVRIQGEEEFDLGPHGMFRLVPGKSCVVTNRLYWDALLHVCEFPE